MRTKAHICPECGEKLPLKSYLTLPGDYNVECPNCKSKLKPELSDFHKIVPWILAVLIIFTAINQKSGLTGFLIAVGIMTLICFLILIAGAYYFIGFRKTDGENE